ncbi:MAG: pyruvate formate lyase family protein [Candidatus Freyarchaeum deiterrae]
MLKDRLYSRHMETDIERALYYTRAYKRSEGQPACIRAALGLEETLRNMTIRIEDGERIVGSKSAKEWGGPMYLEAGGQTVWTAMALMFHGKPDALKATLPNGALGVSAEFLRDAPKISEEEYQELAKEILPYWKDNCTQVRKMARWKEEGLAPSGECNAGGVWIGLGEGIGLSVAGGELGIKSDATAGTIDFQGHVTIGIKKVLDMGFKGIAKQAAEQLAKLSPNEEDYEQRKDFLESVQVSAEAACLFAERYAKLAKKMAAKATGQRKEELLKIAKRCHRVPARPPRNFTEAVQAIWLTQAMVLIAYGDSSITCPGRVDQFLYPYYKKDIQKGLITREDALEIIEEYYLKLATNIYFGPNNVTIGGLNKEGEDATNEVSYLFVEAHRNLKGLRNGLAIRISPKTPRDFLLKACEVHRITAGIAFHNDNVLIPSLMGDGYSLADARDYSIVGCTEPTGTGNNNGDTAGNAIFPVALLETALYEGRRAKGQKRLGLATPPASEFKTFEDVKKAYEDQLNSIIDITVKRGDSRDRVIAETYPIPILSSTIEGCVESGKDITMGGARYNHGAVGCQALATVADSLTAVKWAVFDKKLVSMEELMKNMSNNFEGAESLRRKLLSAPKYGNDDPYADEIAAWVANLISRTITNKKFRSNGRYRTCLISSLTQTAEGATCGATPDGRLAGTPVSNGMSPTNGADTSGATAALRSAALMPNVGFSDGTALNVNFNPSIIKTEEGLEKFAFLIEGYFALGGRHVQFNPMSKATLLDAQAHPENYTDLNVKVSGFSERFIDMPKSLQNDIIARTEHVEI